MNPHEKTCTTVDDMEKELSMTDEQRLNLYARTLLCGVECMVTQDMDNITHSFKCGVSSSQDGRMTTWVPKKCIPVLLVGTSARGNLVILCKSGIYYKLSSALEIPPLPPGVILIGNCTLDYDDTFKLLFYDGYDLPPVSSTSTTGVGQKCSSTERYEKLRNFFPRYFQGSDTARSTFVLQWVGYYESACAFLAGDINVGHEVGGLVSTTDDAMKPTRPVRVQVPNIAIKRFRNLE